MPVIHALALLLLTAPTDYSKLIRLKTLAQAKQALAAGTSPNATGGDRTWLSFAAEANKLDLAALLIENGAKLETPDQGGCTPLCYAVDYAGVEMVKLLLAKGAKPSPQVGPEKRTPLHRLMGLERKTKMDLIATLTENGADVNAADARDETPLHAGAEAGEPVRLKYLIERGAKVDATNKNGATPLHLAAISRRLAAMQLLVEKGAKVDARDKSGETPLLRLVYIGADVELLKAAALLVKLGANVSSQNDAGESALHVAVVTKSEPWAKTLMQFGVDPSLRSKKGKTALDQAVINKDATLIVAIGRSAPKALNALDEYGATYVHNAVINDDLPLLNALIAAGADLSVKNKFGKTPLGTARQAGMTKIAALLEELRAAD